MAFASHRSFVFASGVSLLLIASAAPLAADGPAPPYFARPDFAAPHLQKIAALPPDNHRRPAVAAHVGIGSGSGEPSAISDHRFVFALYGAAIEADADIEQETVSLALATPAARRLDVSPPRLDRSPITQRGGGSPVGAAAVETPRAAADPGSAPGIGLALDDGSAPAKRRGPFNGMVQDLVALLPGASLANEGDTANPRLRFSYRFDGLFDGLD